MTIDDIELVMSEFKHCIRLAKEVNYKYLINYIYYFKIFSFFFYDVF